MLLRWSDGDGRAHEFDSGDSRDAIAFAVGVSLPLAAESVGESLRLDWWDTFGMGPRWVSVTSEQGRPLVVRPYLEWGAGHEAQVADRVLSAIGLSIRRAGIDDGLNRIVGEEPR